MLHNPALNLAPFSRWTLRDKAAQRRLALLQGLPVDLRVTRDPWRYPFCKRHVDGEATNGHSKLYGLLRTLMKDARRGFHSL